MKGRANIECKHWKKVYLISYQFAEMMAIIVGLQWVEEIKPDRVVCCVDSVAALFSIQNMKSNKDVMLEIHQIEVRCCWVPAHVNRFERADKL